MRALFHPVRSEPSCLIFPAKQANVTKDLQEKCEYHRALSKYFCLHFLLTRFSYCRILISALDASQEVMRYVFKLLFHADDDAKGFRSSISSAAKRRAESTWSSYSASGCCEELVYLAKKIMKAVSLSSTQQVALECVYYRFLLAKASDSACGQNP